MTLPILRETADTVRFFDPNGEEITLADAPTELVAWLRDEIRTAEEDQRVAKQTLDAELHRRMDYDNTLTLRAPGYTITGKAPEAIEWDAEALKAVLSGLVDAGLLSDVAARRALEPVLVLKPHAGELKKLAAKTGPVGDAVSGCQRRVPQARRATVKRVAADD
jgi:NAD(P)H-hydrate repair Nnr-like enzyme with NAD(P)H-hydrate dehydratase domain